MIKTPIPDRSRILAPVVLTGLLTILPLAGLSQTTEIQLVDNLRQARSVLQQLDDLATACLVESAGTAACPEFLEAVDGDLLITYLDSCRIAKAWRDEFVIGQAQGDELPSSRSDTLLNYLVEVEYLCGENALARTTDSVLPAYRLTRSSGSVNSSLARSLQYQLNSNRQDTLLDQQRGNFSQEVSAQSTRAQRAVQRQFDQLELELIRQQLNQQLPR